MSVYSILETYSISLLPANYVHTFSFYFQECLSTKLLTIGYLYYWPIVEVTKSAKNAVTRVVRELSSQIYKVSDWKLSFSMSQ